MQYGETSYPNFTDAKAAISTQSFTNIFPADAFVEVFRVAILESCTNLKDDTKAQILFTGGGGSSGGGAGGVGTVTNVAANPSNGVTATVTNSTTTPSIAIGLGNITPLSVASAGFVSDANGDVRVATQNSQVAAYTLVLSDSGKSLLHPSSDVTPRIWTIPANASVAFPLGTMVTFVNDNAAGAISIAITTDTMRLAGAGTTGTRTLAANGIATILKLTATSWIISGSGLT